jgi:hypothetical protein
MPNESRAGKEHEGEALLGSCSSKVIEPEKERRVETKPSKTKPSGNRNKAQHNKAQHKTETLDIAKITPKSRRFFLKKPSSNPSATRGLYLSLSEAADYLRSSLGVETFECGGVGNYSVRAIMGSVASEPPTYQAVSAMVNRIVTELDRTKAEWGSPEHSCYPGTFSDTFNVESYIETVRLMAFDTHTAWQAGTRGS